MTLSIIVLTFTLILLGGIVHGTGSNLACPDWPTCYGSFFPEMKGNIAIEHGHRLLATLVGFLTLIQAGLFFRQRTQKPLLFRLALLAVLLVITQGVLGGVTVIKGISKVYSSMHLGTSMLFLSTLVTIAWLSSDIFEKSRIPLCRSHQWGVRLATFFLYTQIVMGALVRHTAAGIVCTTFPKCYDSYWPVGIHPTITLHMLHRWYGFVVGIFLLITVSTLVRLAQKSGVVLFLSYFIPLLIVAQIMLGIASVLTSLGLLPVTAHLGGGALLLMSMVSLTLLTSQKAENSIS